MHLVKKLPGSCWDERQDGDARYHHSSLKVSGRALKGVSKLGIVLLRNDMGGRGVEQFVPAQQGYEMLINLFLAIVQLFFLLLLLLLYFGRLMC